MDISSWIGNNGYGAIVYTFEGSIVNSKLDLSFSKFSKETSLNQIFSATSTSQLLCAAHIDQVSLITLPKFGEQIIDAIVIPSVKEKSSECLVLLDPIHRSETSKDIFVSKVAHDLRNPLGIAISHLELLLMSLEHEPEKQSSKVISYAKNSLESLRQGLDLLVELRKCYSSQQEN